MSRVFRSNQGYCRTVMYKKKTVFRIRIQGSYSFGSGSIGLKKEVLNNHKIILLFILFSTLYRTVIFQLTSSDEKT